MNSVNKLLLCICLVAGLNGNLLAETDFEAAENSFRSATRMSVGSFKDFSHTSEVYCVSIRHPNEIYRDVLGLTYDSNINAIKGSRKRSPIGEYVQIDLFKETQLKDSIRFRNIGNDLAHTGSVYYKNIRILRALSNDLGKIISYISRYSWDNPFAPTGEDVDLCWWDI